MVFASENFGLSFILEIVSLLFIAAFIVRYVWSGGLNLKGMVNRRLDQIRTQLAQGTEARAATAALVVLRNEALARAHVDASEIAEQARRSAGQLLEEGTKRAEEEYRRFVTRAYVDIELERNRVRDEVMVEIGALVVEAAQRVIDAELSDSLHRHFIDSAISAAESEAGKQ